MKGQWITVAALLLALACEVAGLTSLALALFFGGAALAIAFWLHGLQPRRRSSPRRLARTGPRH